MTLYPEIGNTEALELHANYIPTVSENPVGADTEVCAYQGNRKFICRWYTRSNGWRAN